MKMRLDVCIQYVWRMSKWWQSVSSTNKHHAQLSKIQLPLEANSTRSKLGILGEEKGFRTTLS